MKALALLVLLAGIAMAQQTVRKPMALTAGTTAVIPQMVDGGLNRSTVIFISADPAHPATYHIDFYNDNGTAATFSFAGLGAVDHIDGVLTAGQSAFYTTDSGAAIVQQGWGSVNRLYTSASVAVIQIMDIKDPTTGKFTSEAMVAGTEPFIVTAASYPFDNTEGNVSSMAICNTSIFGPESVSATVIDSSGNTVATDVITLGALNHTAFILADRWPALAGIKGTVIFQPVGSASGVAQVSIMALRFAAVSNGFTVTALPAFDP